MDTTEAIEALGRPSKSQDKELQAKVVGISMGNSEDAYHGRKVQRQVQELWRRME